MRVFVLQSVNKTFSRDEENSNLNISPCAKDSFILLPATLSARLITQVWAPSTQMIDSAVLSEAMTWKYKLWAYVRLFTYIWDQESFSIYMEIKRK